MPDPRQEHTRAGDGVGAPESVSDDEDDLNAGLAGLSLLITGSQPLEVLLTRVADLAVRAIPGADGAGVAMHENGVLSTVVASAPFVRDIDDIQYGLGEGPCVSATAHRRVFVTGSLGGEQRRWPRFGPRVGRLGVHSALSLPLLVSDEVIGAINVYAHAKDVFDENAGQFGELFAASAAVAVHNVRVLHQAERLTRQLQVALTSRAIIDQAIGIIISRSGGTASEAFTALQNMSQREHVKLAVVAAQLVDEAAARARARHKQR
jgi:GAF domain-containing protein